MIYLGNLVKSLYNKSMSKQAQRPDWDNYFIGIMSMVGKRGTCDRGQVGCILVKDNHILSTGYAGAPKGIKHCDDVGHEMNTVIHPDGHESQHCVRTVHAEQNAIVSAARLGIAIDQATLYCNMTPCYICAKLIINAGIKRVVAVRDYHAAARSKEIFAEAGIQYELRDESVELYDNQ